ncbi:Aspartate aminotransferase [hydrothermal vent metagenome]|uniref:Aspartate aminotransferase n=1 Tax=hydrothermal vent metagenome TaxID=652676 RepID=A0A3B0RTG0_9ZZZZ
MPTLSPLLERFKPSAISGMMGTVARLQAEGKKLYDFSTGEPDFDTPEHIKQAAIEAVKQGDTKYSPTDGTIAVRQAVQRKFERDNNLGFALEQVIVATGAKPLIADIIRTMAGPGDEIVLAAPAWPSHVGMIELAGAEPVFVRAGQGDGFIMGPEQLAGAITAKTRAVLLCSPSNPTGAVYGQEALTAIAEVLRQHPDLWIITDDLYEHIVYDNRQFHSILNVAPDLAERTVVINGVSKAYAMTGWRIGYAAGPAGLMNGVRKVMSQATGCPCSVSQAAAVAALDGPLESVGEFVTSYQARRDRSVAGLNQTPGIDCLSPQGAFYLYPSCAGIIGKHQPDETVIKSSHDFANYLLNDWSVAVVPGSAFELDPHFRISTATADDELDAGIAQIKKAVAALV